MQNKLILVAIGTGILVFALRAGYTNFRNSVDNARYYRCASELTAVILKTKDWNNLDPIVTSAVKQNRNTNCYDVSFSTHKEDVNIVINVDTLAPVTVTNAMQIQYEKNELQNKRFRERK